MRPSVEELMPVFSRLGSFMPNLNALARRGDHWQVIMEDQFLVFDIGF